MTLPKKWFFGLAALLLLLLLAINLALDATLPRYLVGRVRADLTRDAITTRRVFGPKLSQSPSSREEINALAHELADETGLRVTLIARDGTVLAESDRSTAELASIANHLDRPEIQEALRTGTGSATRRSDTVGRDLLYVAVAMDPGARGGFVRVALPLDQVDELISRVRRSIAFATLLVGVLVLPILFWLARRTTRPILEMADVAGRVAKGDFSQHVESHPGSELSMLSNALNEMSTQLESRLRELERGRAGLGAILAGMTEGVLVVDATGRIQLANESLRRQFHLGDDVLQRTVLEGFRNPELAELVASLLRGDVQSGDREMNFLMPEERVFSVRAAALQSAGAPRTGVVVVFHDITRLQQLENIRKEFVANVSHELRTPLSIIKGYLETLLDRPEPDAAERQRFLETMRKHAERLESLIADLLSISSLESQQAELRTEPIALSKVVDAVTREMEAVSKRRSMKILSEIASPLPEVRADTARIHQVWLNLLDNALKYTPEGGSVTLRVISCPGEIECVVEDNGPGIPPEHLPHLFERFYRVDRARSRELGGTGLGLSIVKHIVQAHGGRVWVESRVGHGSAFHFTLPTMSPSIAGSRTPRVLFICVENSCRSQIAEALVRIHGAGRVEANSAGSRPSGRVNPRGIELMKERGYDLSQHRSKSLDDVPDVEYDAAITMGCGDACPHVRSRRREDWNIADPKEMAADEFRAVIRRIEEKVRALIAETLSTGFR